MKKIVIFLMLALCCESSSFAQGLNLTNVRDVVIPATGKFAFIFSDGPMAVDFSNLDMPLVLDHQVISEHEVAKMDWNPPYLTVVVSANRSSKYFQIYEFDGSQLILRSTTPIEPYRMLQNWGRAIVMGDNGLLAILRDDGVWYRRVVEFYDVSNVRDPKYIKTITSNDGNNNLFFNRDRIFIFGENSADSFSQYLGDRKWLARYSGFYLDNANSIQGSDFFVVSEPRRASGYPTSIFVLDFSDNDRIKDISRQSVEYHISDITTFGNKIYALNSYRPDGTLAIKKYEWDSQLRTLNSIGSSIVLIGSCPPDFYNISAFADGDFILWARCGNGLDFRKFRAF